MFRFFRLKGYQDFDRELHISDPCSVRRLVAPFSFVISFLILALSPLSAFGWSNKLQSGWDAYRKGDFSKSERIYKTALLGEPDKRKRAEALECLAILFSAMKLTPEQTTNRLTKLDSIEQATVLKEMTYRFGRFDKRSVKIRKILRLPEPESTIPIYKIDKPTYDSKSRKKQTETAEGAADEDLEESSSNAEAAKQDAGVETSVKRVIVMSEADKELIFRPHTAKRQIVDHYEANDGNLHSLYKQRAVYTDEQYRTSEVKDTPVWQALNSLKNSHSLSQSQLESCFELVKSGGGVLELSNSWVLTVQQINSSGWSMEKVRVLDHPDFGKPYVLIVRSNGSSVTATRIE